MNAPQIVSVVAATNDAYSQHCAVMIASVLTNTTDPTRVQLHVLDCGLSNTEMSRIQQTCKTYGSNVEFHHVDKDILRQLPETTHTQASYARIFIGSLLPETLKRVIYLDSDLIVKDNIIRLFNWDLQQKPIASARDFSSTAAYRLANPPLNYFNSGVLVIDLAYWRNHSIEKRIIDYLIETHDNTQFADQDALNVIFKENWIELPPRWNTQLGVYTTRPRRWERQGFKTEDLEEALKNPAIVHYINNSKPWLFRSNHPLKFLYWKYLKSTPYSNYRYPDFNTKTLIEKTLHIQRLLKGFWCRQKFNG